VCSVGWLTERACNVAVRYGYRRPTVLLPREW
jgi:hypothetical protein